jgi:hypothetical protein
MMSDAYRLEQGVYRPWHPDAAGRWRSEEIAVAIGMESGLAAVYTLDGRRQLREGEVARELARTNDELNALRRLVEQLKQHQHQTPGDER